MVLQPFYELFDASKCQKDRKLSDFINKIFICGSKMNESLTDL